MTFQYKWVLCFLCPGSLYSSLAESWTASVKSSSITVWEQFRWWTLAHWLISRNWACTTGWPSFWCLDWRKGGGREACFITNTQWGIKRESQTFRAKEGSTAGNLHFHLSLSHDFVHGRTDVSTLAPNSADPGVRIFCFARSRSSGLHRKVPGWHRKSLPALVWPGYIYVTPVLCTVRNCNHVMY